MELDISAMIDKVETFIEGGWRTDTCLTVGGMAGTLTFKNVLNAIVKTVDFNKIMIVDGCRDYIGLARRSVPNYLFYQDLFRHMPSPDLIDLVDPMRVRVVFPKEGHILYFNTNMVKNFDVMLVNNAQLIPHEYMKMIKTQFCGKLVLIVDPFEIHAENYAREDYVTDVLSKQSMNIAFARSLFDVETRAIDRKVRCSCEQIKMARRSIGKADTKQYITNSDAVLNEVREKQYRIGAARRNMRFVLKEDYITFLPDQDERLITLGPQTMFSVMSVTKTLLKLRIHSTQSQIWSSISYKPKTGGLYVEPANIISLDQAVHHRFKDVVMVLGEEPMTKRQWYTLLKIANNISIVNF